MFRPIDLARHGNLELAVSLAQTEQEEHDCRVNTSADPGVFSVSVFDDVARFERITAQVGVPNEKTESELFRKTILDAREQARQLVGATHEEADRLWIQRPLTHALPVDGSSIGLAAALAFVERLAGVTVPQKVIATGWFTADLGPLARHKQAALVRESIIKDSGTKRLYSAVKSIDGFSMDFCGALSQATERVFGMVPWAAGDATARIHGMTCGKVGPEGSESIALGDQSRLLHSSEILPAARSLYRRLQTENASQRILLSLAGPVPLALAVGVLCRNLQATVIFEGNGHRWWWNRATVAIPCHTPTGGQRTNLFVPTLAGRTAPDQSWQVLEGFRERLLPSNLPAVLSSIASTVQFCEDFGLLLTGPLGLAFAIGQSLGPHWPGAVYHLQHQVKQGAERLFSLHEITPIAR